MFNLKRAHSVAEMRGLFWPAMSSEYDDKIKMLLVLRNVCHYTG
jgi:hypothetical protein